MADTETQAQLDRIERKVDAVFKILTLVFAFGVGFALYLAETAGGQTPSQNHIVAGVIVVLILGFILGFQYRRLDRKKSN
jgi:hypothetical protein